MPATRAPDRPGGVSRFLGWLLGTGRNDAEQAAAVQEELFRIRGELAVLRAEIEAMHAEVGRRDIATLEELLRAGNRRQVEALIRDRTQTVPLPDGSALCRVLGRFKLFVDATDGGIAPHLLLDGYWEYWVTEFLCRNVARGETACDVGAIYGYYSLLLAELVGPEGRVVALEPNPWLHWLLGRNVTLNGLGGRLAAHRLAVGAGARDGVTLPALMTGPADGPLASHFAQEEGRQVFTAPAASLPEAAGGPVDLLRIGFMPRAIDLLPGCEALAVRNPGIRILLEFDAGRTEEPAALLGALGARWPLRFIDGDSRAKACTAAELIEARRVATLYLSMVEPR
ncbi:FkbM family methyltransferase [Roseomonas sp. PWR1]|uniref:FkbM family methyltransferase n=1 Tax=Roseomonas nitratireducens TaxID=2820810 RepID=A0ABS4AUC9_9PROT|nr:FkbM family methyltransferase [Neoroseomonas nitratireducens]MBP0464972.1 FkbM family methyltransferase [Neoroseomonas nitratireducens]